MTIEWDSTGKYIVGPAFGAGQFWGTPTSSDLADTSGTNAIHVQLLDPQTTNYPPGSIQSHVTTYDAGDGMGPQSYTYTVVPTWIAPFFFPGDVVQDILDLLANPPS